jgi:hypothetical protein
MAAANEQIDLAYRLLDLDLVDSEGVRCGKVDDLVLTGGPGEGTYVAAIRTGPGALPQRFIPRLRRLARRVFRQGFTDVPSTLVEDFDSVVTLTATAPELGLGDGDRRLAKMFGAPSSQEGD